MVTMVTTITNPGYHNNPPQVTVQQVFRTFAFLAESCVFAYLGMAIFSFTHSFHPSLIVWSIVSWVTGREVVGSFKNLAENGILTLRANC